MLRRGVQCAIAVVAATSVILAAACGNNGIVTYQQPYDASVFVDHYSPPAGVGDACGATIPCRSGLACSAAGTCAPGYSTPTGAPCVINDECVAGDYCGGLRQCTPDTPEDSGGVAGSDCSNDGDCAAGLRCDPVGLSAQCQPEGAGDVGAACTSSADCFGGLDCESQICTAPPATTGPPPPVGLSTWPGVDCADDPPPTKAYFQVPREPSDGGPGTDFFRLPFPNDARLNGTSVDMSGFPTPGSSILGYDLVARYVGDVEANTQGFSTWPTVTIRFSAPVDFSTLKLPQALQWLELTEGAAVPVGFEWTMTTGRNQYVCPNALTARPQQGIPLIPGTTYAFVVSSSVLTAADQPIQMDSDLQALLGSTAPTDPALTNAYTAYAPLRAWVSANGGASSIIAATVFTTGPTNSLAPSAVAAVQAAPAPTATGWINCASAPSPCPQATGDRACGAPDPAFYELHGLVTLPIVQAGTEPYWDPDAGGDISLDSNGNAQVVRTEQVCMALTVPKTTMPAGGWPLVIFAHGTGGSFRSHVPEGVAANLAGAMSSAGVATPMAVLGIDQVETGTRRGASTDSPDNLFYNFGNPGASRGNPIQGAADQASLLILAKSLALDASLTGSAIKFGEFAFWGHSQGATEGGLAMPYVNGYAGAVLSGEGASLIDALLTKTNPVDVAAVVPAVIQDPAVNIYHPVLALLQASLDQDDPLNHALYIAAAPTTTGTAKHLFQPYGLGDTYAPPVTEATFAIAAHLGVAASTPSVTTPDSIGGISPVPVPASGNLTVGAKKITAFVREYQPSGYDGHFVAFDNPDAETDVATFLADVVNGTVPSVGQ
ncbi:MAG: hypothetical protein ACLQVI_40160 [Polyangiaceae bacterium]